jgi:hypothetical protein
LNAATRQPDQQKTMIFTFILIDKPDHEAVRQAHRPAHKTYSQKMGFPPAA